MSMTPQQARDAIKKYGGTRPAARALGVAYSGLWRKANQADAPAPKASQPAKDSAQAQKKMEDFLDLPAINLSPVTRIVDRRPAVTVRSKFFALPKGKAFRVSDLSKRWGFSTETIKRHARDESCFAYVDTTGHDDFEECVLHPETAASRLKGN